MPAGRRIIGVGLILPALILSGCQAPQPAEGGSAVIQRTQHQGTTGSTAPSSPGGTHDGASNAANPSPSTSSGTTTPSANPSSASPSASASPTPSQLADFRASGLWHDLGTAQQAGGVVATVMKWRNPEGVVGPIPNGDALWGELMPPLRDQLLTRHLEQGAIPTPVFAGTPYQTAQSVRVVTWWTNGPGGTAGRGQMFLVIAGWKSREGVDHIDLWPVLIGFGAGSAGGTKAGRINAVGERITIPTASLNPDQQAAFAAISAQINPWVHGQPVSEDPIELTCPQSGCST